MGGLGTRIRQLRQSRGLTQEQLAGRELTKSFISLLEREKTSPSVETLGLLARRLGTSVDGIMGSQDRLPEQVSSGLLTPGAVRHLSASLETLRKAKASRDPARVEALIHLASALVYAGDYPRAIKRYYEAARAQTEQRHPVILARALWGPGAAYRHQRELSSAHEALIGSRDLFEKCEELPDLIRVRHSLGQVAAEQQHHKDALRHYHHALRVAERLKMKVLRANVLTEIARVHVTLGSLDDAAAFASQALAEAKAAADPVEVAEANVVLARIAFARGNAAEGTRLIKTAAETFTAQGMPHRVAELAREAGMALLER